MKEHILERNPKNAINVVKPFHATVTSKDIEEHILGEKRYKCNQCSKAFSCHRYLKKHKRRHAGDKV